MKKITTNTKTLLNAVATANNYTSKDGDFAGVITLIGKNGQMEVKATDMVQTIIFKNISFQSGDLTNQDFDTFSLDGKKLATVLKAAKSDEIIFEIDDNFIVVKSNRSRVKIEIFEKAQNVKIAKGYGKQINLSENILNMESVVHAIDQNNPKYELNGLLLKRDKQKISMVATDSRRLAVVSSEAKEEDIEFDIILPKQAITTITKLFNGIDSEAEVDEVLFSIHSPFVSYSTKLISGKFPDYERIMPKNFNQTTLLNVTSLKEIASEASMFESDIIVSVDNQKLRATDVSRNTEVEMPQDETIDKNVNLFFAVNAKFILDILAVVKEEYIQLCFNETNLPFILKTGNLEEVIMPVQLPDEIEMEEAA